MKKRIPTVVITLLAAAVLAIIGAGIFVYAGIYDIAASTPHSRTERALLTTVQRHSVEAHARHIKAPPLDDPGLIRHGLVQYREHCVACHGAPGEAKARLGVGMNPNPPPLEIAVTNWRPAEIYWIIDNGLKMAGMPAFGLGESPRDLWALTAFVVRMNTLSPMEYRAMVDAVEPGAYPDATAAIDWTGRRDPGWETLGARGDADRGRHLISELGCGTCHHVPGIATARGRLAPPLAHWARRHYLAGRALNRPADLVPWIMDPQAIKPGTAMPAVGATETDAWHIASFLYTLE